jgi:hypothetical protein
MGRPISPARRIGGGYEYIPIVSPAARSRSPVRLSVSVGESSCADVSHGDQDDTVVRRRVGGGFIYSQSKSPPHRGRPLSPGGISGMPGADDARLGEGRTGAIEDKDVAAKAITHLLRQAIKVDPMDGLLADGLRPLAHGPRLTLHLARASPTVFPLFVRDDAKDHVLSVGPELPLDAMASRTNPFFDSGVLKYFEMAGAAMPATPLVERQLLAAAVWYVCSSMLWCYGWEGQGWWE